MELSRAGEFVAIFLPGEARRAGGSTQWARVDSGQSGGWPHELLNHEGTKTRRSGPRNTRNTRKKFLQEETEGVEGTDFLTTHVH